MLPFFQAFYSLRNPSYTMSKFQPILLLLFLVDQVWGWRSRRSFQHFFTDVEVEIQNAIVNHCSDNLKNYLDEHTMLYGHQCVKMYSCIMANMFEYTKANMASAAVQLGQMACPLCLKPLRFLHLTYNQPDRFLHVTQNVNSSVFDIVTEDWSKATWNPSGDKRQQIFKIIVDLPNQQS